MTDNIILIDASKKHTNIDGRINAANIVEKLLEKIDIIIKSDLKIQGGNMIHLVTIIMELVEKISRNEFYISGAKKAEIVTNVAIKAIDFIPDNILSEEDKKDFIILIPNTIEIIIKASKGEFKLKKSGKNNIKVNTILVTDRLYERIKKFIKDRDFDIESISSNLFLVATKCMTLVEEYPSMAGSDKKAVVLQVMKKLSRDLPEIFPGASPKQLHLVRSSMDILPSLIDTIIDAARGKFDINRFVEQIPGCISIIMTIFKK